eukprot:GGOE01001012.1.p1 GENE.GGOE01001012.1~~GGOE01001012.1.p1  ORF type:complete len:488 (+),score=121.41 GGOE01001012.1:1188-2651(+)
MPLVSIFAVPALLVSFLSTLVLANVETLTETNFDEFISQNELVLVEFYAPWCGHCKRLEPEYERAAKELAGQGPVLAKVDATAEKSLGERFDVEGYPTLKVFHSGNPSPYEGGRTAKDIVAFMKKQAGPAVKLLDTADTLAEFIPKQQSDDPVVVAFADADSPLANFIAEFAKKFRNEYSFGLVTAATLAGDESMETIVLFKAFDELKNVYTGELSEDALINFLKTNSVKAVDEIGPQNYAAYVKRGLPISWLFIDPSDQEATDSALDTYRRVAPELKRDLSLVYLSGVQYQQMATKLGLTGKKYPSLAVDRSGEHFVFPEDQLLTEEALQEWFKRYLLNELAPFIKSEPIPDSLYDENHVAIVVGDNFKEVVLDDTKDVLVEFYAPWCGHCKSLVPTWNTLGKVLKGVSSVVIAKTDATANDYPAGFQVSGFPTIKLVTSKDNKVIDYSGGREVSVFINWLREHAATPFEVSGEADEGRDDDDEEL